MTSSRAYPLEQADHIFRPLPGKDAPRYSGLMYYSATLAIDTPGLDDLENRIFALSPLLQPAQIGRYLAHFAPDFDIDTSLAGRRIPDIQEAVAAKLDARSLPHAVTRAFEAGWWQVQQPTLQSIAVLPDRPQHFLKLISEGYSPAEAGQSLQLAPTTVKNYERALLRRLRAANMMGAVLVSRLTADTSERMSSDLFVPYGVQSANSSVAKTVKRP